MAIADDIKARVDIVDVVGQYVPELKQSGRNFTARCPFHQERTASFVVFPERQTWRCFGACATGGDVFNFVMRAEHTDFMGALKLLAPRAGVPLAEVRRAPAPRNPIFTANEAALRLFSEALASERGAVARDYLRQRGVNEGSVTAFGIGYAPATGDDLLRRLVAMELPEDLLLRAGLVTRGDGTGPARDLFRGRLTFALRNERGEIVGFAGRSLDGAEPKYLNSPQTAVFDKGRLLYGLDRAQEAVRRDGTVVVVEGYFDVIAAHQAGFRNVVASMGTALTPAHVQMLRERAQAIVLALDPDAAGKEATLRSLRTSWQFLGQAVEGKRTPPAGARLGDRATVLYRARDLDALRVAVLPDGVDPDELIHRDPNAWLTLTGRATPVASFLVDSAPSLFDMATGEGKQAAAEFLWPVVMAIGNFPDQDRYVQRLADLVGVERGRLEAAMARRPRPAPARAVPGAPAPRPGQEALAPVMADGEPLEDHLVALFVHYPELLARVSEVPAEHLRRTESRAVLSAMQQAGTLEAALARLDGQAGEYVERLAARELPPSDRIRRDHEFELCTRRLEERFLRDLKTQEAAALAPADPDGAPDIAGYSETLDRQRIATNERLRELFVSNAPAPRQRVKL